MSVEKAKVVFTSEDGKQTVTFNIKLNEDQTMDIKGEFDPELSEKTQNSLCLALANEFFKSLTEGEDGSLMSINGIKPNRERDEE